MALGEPGLTLVPLKKTLILFLEPRVSQCKGLAENYSWTELINCKLL